MSLAESAIAQTSPSSPRTVALSPTGKPWTQEHFTGLCESHQSEKPFYYTPITAHRLFPGIESEKCIYARRDNFGHILYLWFVHYYVQNKSQLTGNNSLISSTHLPKMTPSAKWSMVHEHPPVVKCDTTELTMIQDRKKRTEKTLF